MLDGLHAVKKIGYENPSTLVAVFKDQDAVVIILSNYAASDAQEKLIDATIEAGVRFILPNEWSPDTDRKRGLENNLRAKQATLRRWSQRDQAGQGDWFCEDDVYSSLLSGWLRQYGKFKGTLDTLLGLTHEDIDVYTALAIERSKGPQWTHWCKA